MTLLTPGIGFDRYLSRLEEAASNDDRDGMERLHAEYGVTIAGPSVAERLGISVQEPAAPGPR